MLERVVAAMLSLAKFAHAAASARIVLGCYHRQLQRTRVTIDRGSSAKDPLPETASLGRGRGRGRDRDRRLRQPCAPPVVLKCGQMRARGGRKYGVSSVSEALSPAAFQIQVSRSRRLFFWGTS